MLVLFSSIVPTPLFSSRINYAIITSVGNNHIKSGNNHIKSGNNHIKSGKRPHLVLNRIQLKRPHYLLHLHQTLNYRLALAQLYPILNRQTVVPHHYPLAPPLGRLVHTPLGSVCGWSSEKIELSFLL